MEFKKYQHLERFGKTEVRDIAQGEVYVFPKLDGTNASVWLNSEGELMAGSRNRELSHEKDNAGFYNTIKDDVNVLAYLKENPTHRLYGEWLVPHSLKTYRDDAWRKFYIFDVVKEYEEEVEYLHYDEYQPLLEKHNLEYLAPLVKLKGSIIPYESIAKTLEDNTYLIKDGEGTGEGVVIKNYGYKNQFGKVVWAKIVTNEFKEVHKKSMGTNEIAVGEMIEQEIVDKYCTQSFVEKEFEKLKLELGEWTSKAISQLISRVWYEFLKEELYHMVKELKNPTIDFKTLNYLVVIKIKKSLPEIF